MSARLMSYLVLGNSFLCLRTKNWKETSQAQSVIKIKMFSKTNASLIVKLKLIMYKCTD